MKKARKIAALVMAAAMSLCVLPSSAIADELVTPPTVIDNADDGTNNGSTSTDYSENSGGDQSDGMDDNQSGDGTTTGDEVTNGDGTTGDGTEGEPANNETEGEPANNGTEGEPEEENNDDPDNGISLMSLLPLPEHNNETAIINRTEGVPSGFEKYSDYAYYVKEVLGDILLKYGEITDTENCSKTIFYSENNRDYKKVEWNDVIVPDNVSSYNSYKSTAYFIVGNGDQLDINNTRYKIEISFLNINIEFENGLKFNLYDKNKKLITPVSSQMYDVNVDDQMYYNCYQTVSYDYIKEQYPMLSVILPDGYSSGDVKIYENLIYDKDSLTSANEITQDLIGGKMYQLSNYYKEMTFAVTKSSGYVKLIPVRFSVYTNSTIGYYIELKSLSGDLGSIYDPYADSYYYPGGSVFYEKTSFNDVNATITASYNGTGYKGAEFACFGHYNSIADARAAGEADISSSLFSPSGAPVDFSRFTEENTVIHGGTRITTRKIDITVFDKNGVVFPLTYNYSITPLEKKIKKDTYNTDTYFNIYAVGIDDTAKPYLHDYAVSSYNDSYFMNGYQTVFILNNDDSPVINGTEIYPYFNTSGGARINRRDISGEQFSGKSPVTFTAPETVVKYYASSENNTNLKNYWVTFVTQQEGPHLFVNGANIEENYSTNNNPKREVFLNKSHNYVHDILIANTGNQTLTGITATLSSDTNGVKLDPYWQVTENSIGQLNPFTTTSYSGIDNIAKIRLVPVNEDDFTVISGTLTISSENGGSYDIELSGIAGVPKITTTQADIYEGVKYVPYSCFIGTNNMYESDKMTFKLVGDLPDGLTLNEHTGEIYGVPKKAGSFPITVQATYTGNVPTDSDEYTSTASYILVIKDNTDDNVDAVNSDKQGKELTKSIDKYLTVYYNGKNGNYPISIDRVETENGGLLSNEIFESQGKYADEFMAFYLDGENLKEGQDYNAVEGSTVITIVEQTLKNLAIEDNSTHTLAAEFREGKDPNKALSRSAQNIHLKYVNLHPENDITTNGSGNSGSTSNPGSTANSASSTTIAPVTKSTITTVMNLVDENGNPLSGISLELHSDPMTAVTDENGAAEFKEVDFGKHTLYVKDSEGKTLAKQTFYVASGTEFKIKGDVITAKKGEPLYLSVRFDGSEITFLSAGEDVSAGAGIGSTGEIIGNYMRSGEFYIMLVLILFPIIGLAAAMVLFAKKRNN